MKINGLSSLLGLLLILGGPACFAQENDKEAPSLDLEQDQSQTPQDQNTQSKSSFRPAKEVLEDMTQAKGFNSIYTDAKKLRGYLEIPVSSLKRPFLLATSVSGGSTFAGWQIGHHLLYWKRHDKSLMLIEKNVQYRAKSSNPLSDAVNRTYSDELILTLPIEGKTTRGGYLIELKALFARNASKFFGSAGGGLDSRLAEFTKIKVFPTNNEIAVTMPQRGGGSFITLHYSMRKAPRSSYKPRAADDRIGYFLTVAKDFDNGKYNDNRFVRRINRWNLEKLDSKLELSPVKKPIVFYLEKTIPVAYRRFVANGILEWNKAFEKIGFLDAVQVRQQTATNEFKDFDPEDARYNFIRWITSERAFAMGPSRTHPVTGEILDADIIFDDAMVNWAITDYERFFDQYKGSKTLFTAQLEALPAAKQRLAETLLASSHIKTKFERAMIRHMARNGKHDQHHVCQFGDHKRHEMALAVLTLKTAKKKLPLKFIGQFIKETVMHEVGHTLGLRHNFVASSWLALDKVNGKDKPAATSASVMDYNPINVANDAKSQGFMQTTTLGPYDYWAIEYGYGDKGSAEDLQKIAAQSTRPEYQYSTDEDVGGPDPYVNRWDMGKEPLSFAKSRVELAKTMEKDLETRVLSDGQSYRWLRWAFANLVYEYDNAAGFATRYIGGVRIYRDHFSKDAKRDPVEPVDPKKQREALNFVLNEIVGSGKMEFRPELLRKLGSNHWGHWGSNARSSAFPVVERVKNLQVGAVKAIFSSARMKRILDNEMHYKKGTKALTLVELFESSTASITSELEINNQAKNVPVTVFRRNLQRAYVDHLITMALDTGSSYPSSARNLAWTTLTSLAAKIKTRLDQKGPELDSSSRSHFEEMRKRIVQARDATYQIGGAEESGGFDLSWLFGKETEESAEGR